MAQLINIAVKVNVKVRHDEEAGVFVSHCPVLNIFSQGETEDEAKQAIEEAVKLHLIVAFRFDRLHQLLLRSGFTMGTGVPDLESFPGEYVALTEVPDNSKQFKIEVPLTLVAAAAKNNPQWQLSH
jgi:predicted RNase H-like HicB family nuclease